MPTSSPRHPDPLRPPRDTRAASSTVRLQREVPEAIRALGALANASYADIVTATIDQTPADPEQVVRTVLGELPRALLLLIPFVQRVFLGFRLKLRDSPEHLIGWKIADRGENWMRIETASWFLTAHVVMHVDEGRISLASFLRYERWPAPLVWPPVSVIHRQVALALVRKAVELSARGSGSHV
jgi:hypothetical protein